MRFKAFFKRFQFEYLWRVLRDAFTRFPLSVVCAATGTVLSMLAVHEIKPLSEENLSRAMLFLGMGMVFFTAVRLYAEGSRIPGARAAALTGIGGAALLALTFVPDHMTVMHGFVLSALSLSMLFAPYIGRAATEDSVWYYNYLNGISLAVAGLSTFILCLGLCAIVGSMDYLLYDMKLSGKIYGHIWIFGAGFFGPVMFMHQISRQFDFEKSECVLLPGIYFIANFLVVPLILIYTWVLYVYFLKMGWQWELPKGKLAYMVTGFGSLGIAARLAVFPMRDSGTVLLRQFYKYFYFLLIVPVILLAIGLYTRVSQYGITEERYAIGICLAWLTGLTVWNIAKPKFSHIKHVPMVLACLFLFGAIGPWGAVPVSVASQAARLENLLSQAGVLGAEGKITKLAQEAPFELRKNISSVLDYMYEGHQKSIEKWTQPFLAVIEEKRKKDGSPVSDCESRNFTRCWGNVNMARWTMEGWGMQYVSQWQGEDSGEYVGINLQGNYGNDENIQKVSPYAYVIRLQPATYASVWTAERAYKEAGQDVLKATFKMTQTGLFSATLGDGRTATFDLQALGAALHKEHVTNLPDDQRNRAILHDTIGTLPAELRVYSLSGRLREGQLKLDSANVLVLLNP
ncbi:MAG: DUF4153 domain-containing protein [Alphaproteobacteria bacterium]